MNHISLSLLFTFLQGIATIIINGVTFGFPSLYITLIAVACTQFDKLKAAILNMRQQQVTPQRWQEDEQVHTTANCDLQVKLNACIRHHQEVVA